MRRVWITKDGQKIEIKNMTNIYIINILNHFDNNFVIGIDRHEMLESIIEEAKKRGLPYNIQFEYMDVIDAVYEDTF